MKEKRGVLNEIGSSFSSSSRLDFSSSRFDFRLNSWRRSRQGSRRGQITIFIIVGIVILFAFAGIFYFTRTVSEEKMAAEEEPVIAAVPQEMQPVKTYTEDCLAQIGKRGLLILGQQGGYIYPELVGKYSVSNPTEADGIDLEPLKVPYWHYNPEPNDADKVVFSSLKPKLYAKDDSEMSIEAQLSRFVEENLNGCIGDYASFKESGFEISAPALGENPTEKKEVVVRVAGETVNFLLEMNVKAKKGEAQQQMNEFFVKVPLKLKHYYEVADLIAETESDSSFLERHGLELLSAYSRVDLDYFPPISGITFGYFSTLSWSEFALKQKYKEVLTSYVPMLRFLGSENFYYGVGGRSFFAQKIVDNMIIPLTGAEDMDVSFDYFGWEPYFKTNSEDGIIKPEHIFVNAWVLSYGQQRYETHYDISYPTLVTLSDDDAFDGAGYQFIFSLESNIRNNRPAEAEKVRETYPARISSLACNNEQKNSDIIKAVVIDSFSKEPLEAVKIGFSIPEQTECEIGMTNKEGVLESRYPAVYGGVINFILPEYLTNFYPIDTYKFKNLKNPLGDQQSSNLQNSNVKESISSVKENIKGSKGSSSALIGYAVEGIKEPEKVIEMDKIKTINVSVKKKSVKKCVGYMDADDSEDYEELDPKDPEEAAEKEEYYQKAKRICFLNDGQMMMLGEPLIKLVASASLSKFHDYYFVNKGEKQDKEEMATVILERVKGFHDEVKGQEFFATFSVSGTEETEVQLVPGIYKVTIISTVNKELVVPEDVRDMAGEEFKFEAVNQEKYIDGNLVWDTPQTYVVITPEDLYTSKKITFFTLTQDIYSVPTHLNIEEEGRKIPARVMEDLQVPGNLADISKTSKIRKALEPKFEFAGEE